MDYREEIRNLDDSLKKIYQAAKTSYEEDLEIKEVRMSLKKFLELSDTDITKEKFFQVYNYGMIIYNKYIHVLEEKENIVEEEDTKVRPLKKNTLLSYRLVLERLNKINNNLLSKILSNQTMSKSKMEKYHKVQVMISQVEKVLQTGNQDYIELEQVIINILDITEDELVIEEDTFNNRR
ncbi:MAG: hypothetical protein R3Y13_05400 [bacterium]